jgi:hypothetical protein
MTTVRTGRTDAHRRGGWLESRLVGLAGANPHHRVDGDDPHLAVETTESTSPSSTTTSSRIFGTSDTSYSAPR